MPRLHHGLTSGWGALQVYAYLNVEFVGVEEQPAAVCAVGVEPEYVAIQVDHVDDSRRQKRFLFEDIFSITTL